MCLATPNLPVVQMTACLLLPALCASAGTQNQSTTPTASLVIRNAKVLTMDQDHPYAQAIALKGEIILAVTTNDAIAAYIKEGLTEVIDAQGRLVVPGFNDAHIHFDAVDPDYLDLRYVRDPAVITQRVKEAVAKARPGELIRGGNWDHELFRDRKWPAKEILDAVSPNNPVVLSRADGHSLLVNSYVIRQSGITRDTPDPEGGEIQHDPLTGEPTGVFKETAVSLLKHDQTPARRTGQEETQRQARGWQMALEQAARYGVTSIQVPSSDDLEVYRKFHDQGKLTLRVTFGGNLTGDPEPLHRYATLQEQYPRSGNWIRFGYLKGFADGTLGSGTALFFDPYADAPQAKGLAQMPYPELERLVVRADEAGFQIGIHAIGDEGNHWVLNAYEKAQEVNGRRDSRHRIEHAQVLCDEDIPRFASLGVVASMQPTHCITDKRFAEKRIGAVRCRGAYAWRSLLKTKAAVAFGTDCPVEPINPLEGLYAAVTRKDRAGEPGDGWLPQEKLTMEEAIRLYTIGSAYAEFTEDRKGMLRKGYLGDVVIFHEDLLTLPPVRLMTAQVDYTIVGGKIVYRRAATD